MFSERARHNVKRTKIDPKNWLLHKDEETTKGTEEKQERVTLQDIEITEYAPSIFCYLRKQDNITDKDIYEYNLMILRSHFHSIYCPSHLIILFIHFI
jgi:hypothetical protein